MLRGPIPETVSLLDSLRKSDTRLYALTNWSAETFPIALNRYEFLHWFHGRLVSGEEKTRKPYPEIYQKLVERFSVDPVSSVYIDDNERNLHPAKEIGMYTIHYQDPAQLKAELQNLGFDV